MTSLPTSRWRLALESPAVPVGMLLVFATLIVLTITRFGTWIDESATLALVGRHDYGDILRLMDLDVHPPLWYLLLKPWLQLFGSTVVVARTQSAVFMLIAAGIWYHFVKTRFSRPVALLALALMVTNPTILHYAIEGRMYAMGVMLVGLSCLALTSTWHRHWIAYWLVCVVMLYTHYFLGLVIAGQFVYLFLRRKEEGKLSLMWIAILGIAIIAAFVPWLPHATHSTKAVQGGFWIPPVQPSTVTNYVLGAFLHRMDRELDGARVFPALAFLMIWAGSLVRATRVGTRPTALLWCIAGIPWVFLFVLSVKPFVPIFSARYVVFGLPALITLLAVGALDFVGRWRAVAIAGLISGQLAGIQHLRWKGYEEVRGWYSMKTVAADVRVPVGGEIPTVVATSLFSYLDAWATLNEDQRLLYLPEDGRNPDMFPEVLFYDLPNIRIASLAEVHDRHVWILENSFKAPTEVPPNWKPSTVHLRGYVRVRLFNLVDP